MAELDKFFDCLVRSSIVILAAGGRVNLSAKLSRTIGPMWFEAIEVTGFEAIEGELTGDAALSGRIFILTVLTLIAS